MYQKYVYHLHSVDNIKPTIQSYKFSTVRNVKKALAPSENNDSEAISLLTVSLGYNNNEDN